MAEEIIIPVKSILGNTLSTREAVTVLLRNIKRENYRKITLDFSNVDFISRSFADSLVKKRNELAHSGSFEFNIKNASDTIISMLGSVEKTQNKNKREESTFIIYNYSDTDLITKYLLSI